MNIRDLLMDVEIEASNLDPNLEITGVTHDSREVKQGYAFVALTGEWFEGDRFIQAARDRGATLIVTSREESTGPEGSWLLVQDPRLALALLAHNFFRRPSFDLILVGITGTNGKTSTTYILESMARAAGMSPGVIGTVSYRYCGKVFPAKLTTPEAPTLQRILREMADAGVDVVFMEVSSHAIAMERVHGCRFSVAGGTNLSQDHLDFHGNLEEYGETKARLFLELLARNPENRGAALNVDDPWAAAVAAKIPEKAMKVSSRGAAADVRTLESTSSAQGIRARVATPRGELKLESNLGGKHNLANLCLAVGIGECLGWSPASMEQGIRDLGRIEGRMDLVPGSDSVNVWVDYAHTPDALVNAIETARAMTHGQLTVIFGAGGDRDAKKRPLMGQAVFQAADRMIITTDNPRTEDPLKILNDVADFERSGGPEIIIEPSRAKAIELAVSSARPGDGVLIAGKGHEYYIEVMGRRFWFDDRVQGMRSLERRKGIGARVFSGTAGAVAEVVGGTLHGAASAEFSLLTTDSRKVTDGTLFVGISGENFDGADYLAQAMESGARVVMAERLTCPVPEGCAVILVKDAVRALGDLAAWWRSQLRLVVICLTGSCGKTTTREMLRVILEQFGMVWTNPSNFNNLIGVPLTIFGLNSHHDYAVIELGTSLPGEIARLTEICRPDLGLVTMAAAAHTQGLGSVQGVAKEKTDLFRGLGDRGLALAPGYDALILEEAGSSPAALLRFGYEDQDDLIIREETGGLTPRARLSWRNRETAELKLRIPGRHNIRNAAAAVAIARSLGVPLTIAAKALESFAPVGGRLNTIEIHGARLINDAYNANPASMAAAVSLMAEIPEGRTFLILGGMAELGADSARAHQELGSLVARSGVGFLATVGPEARVIFDGAVNAGLDSSRARSFESHEACAAWLAAECAPGDTILVKGSRSQRMEKVIEHFKAQGALK